MFLHTCTKLVPPKATHLTTNLNIRTNIHYKQMYSTKKLYEFIFIPYHNLSVMKKIKMLQIFRVQCP